MKTTKDIAQELLTSFKKGETIIGYSNERGNLLIREFFLSHGELGITVTPEWGQWVRTRNFLCCHNDCHKDSKLLLLNTTRTEHCDSCLISATNFLFKMEELFPTKLTPTPTPTPTPKSLLIEGKSMVVFGNGKVRMYAMGGFMGENDSISIGHYDDDLTCTLRPLRENCSVVKIYNKKSNGSCGREACEELEERSFDLVWERNEKSQQLIDAENSLKIAKEGLKESMKEVDDALNVIETLGREIG